MKAWVLRWGPAALIMAVIFIASAIPGSDLPEFGGLDVFAKKGGHMLGYALLAIAYFRALNNGKNTTRSQFLIAACLAGLYAISDEFHQSYVPGRNASPWDICIDVIGGIVGLALWCLVRARFKDWHKAVGPCVIA